MLRPCRRWPVRLNLQFRRSFGGLRLTLGIFFSRLCFHNTCGR